MLSKYTLDQLGTKGHGIASAFSNVSGKVNKIHSNIQTQRANEKAKGGDRDNWGAWEKDIRNSLYKHFIICFWFLPFLVFVFFFFFSLLGLYSQHMEVPRRGVQLELQLPAHATATYVAYTTATAMLTDPRPRIEARDLTHGLVDASRVR